jgi:hypothetical protein
MNEHGPLPDPNTNDPRPPVTAAEEEVLVADPRAELTPAQIVERKLVALLNSAPLPMSRLQSGNSRRPIH